VEIGGHQASENLPGTDWQDRLAHGWPDRARAIFLDFTGGGR
jgi:hypothetical protein